MTGFSKNDSNILLFVFDTAKLQEENNVDLIFLNKMQWCIVSDNSVHIGDVNYLSS